ncbi:MAG TPA: tRNA preQ1(34) S-adenosylmethionine ribosyltransferase-isomerase QueA [Nitrospirales bacterium]
MRLEDFDYPLDQSLIAQQPLEPRDHARLMVVERRTGAISHKSVYALPKLLAPGDLVILNDTRVFAARLFGTKRPSGGKIELLLVRPVRSASSPGKERTDEGNCWHVLIKGKVHPGQRVELPQGIVITILRSDEGRHIVSFPKQTDVLAYAEKTGAAPLPPYIRRVPTESDRERYQTIFARCQGAVAAPTAGLHFTEQLFQNLKSAGVQLGMVTLHVGPGTFKPVTSPDIRQHTMDHECYVLPGDTVKLIEETRARGGRILAVGSTTVRVLETAAASGTIRAESGETNLFIYPGYDFKAVNGILTNFHLPKSTLLMLVCAFAGRERILEAYRLAVAARYRFYSYGDAMLIL